MKARAAAHLLALALFAMPLMLAHAQGLVTCDGPKCGFTDLIATAKNFMRYAIIIIAPIGLAVALAFIIFPYLLSSGFEGIKQNPAARSKMWGDIRNLGKWFGLLVISWLVINFIATVFLGTGVENIFNLE